MIPLLVGGVLGLVIMQGLNGCVDGTPNVAARVAAFLNDSYGLSDEEVVEMGRFATVYRRYANDSDDSRELGHFRDAFRQVRANYVREVSASVLIDNAIRGIKELEPAPEDGMAEPAVLIEAALDEMVSNLDPHSSYLNSDEYNETRVHTSGQFGGLGIEIIMEDEGVRIVSPIEDTPAWRAGLEPNDMITHLDGEPIVGKTLMQAVKIMRGKPGSDIRLTIAREGAGTFDVTVTRAIIRVRSVRWETHGNIGYVRIVSFTEQVEGGLDKAIEDIKRKLGSNLKGLVLDLRGNPGGLLDQSLIVSDAFLKNGIIVSVRGREPELDRAYGADRDDVIDGLPMVVLISGGSASASEIVAGALQDHHRAIIMGTRSFGKGSVQTIRPLPMEGALRLTTALYYAPSDRTIQGLGINPDIVLVAPVNDNDKGDDKAADKAGAEAADAPAKKKRSGNREADLPGFIKTNGQHDTKATATFPLETCPEAGKEGKDKALGCALEYLRAGSQQRFLAGHR